MIFFSLYKNIHGSGKLQSNNQGLQLIISGSAFGFELGWLFDFVGSGCLISFLTILNMAKGFLLEGI